VRAADYEAQRETREQQGEIEPTERPVAVVRLLGRAEREEADDEKRGAEYRVGYDDRREHSPKRSVRNGLLQPASLTTTSAVVLGLVEAAGEATPYELKQGVAVTIGNFWPIPHSQLYAEPERLTRLGYLTERRERGGRRRRVYSITDAGREALAAWRRDPGRGFPQLRDPALLTLFLGADPRELGAIQVAAHRERLAQYEALKATDPGAEPRGPWLALEAGIRHEREWIAYWGALAEGRLE
jgi:PadR family transcriptional regulator AphA